MQAQGLLTSSITRPSVNRALFCHSFRRSTTRASPGRSREVHFSHRIKIDTFYGRFDRTISGNHRRGLILISFSDASDDAPDGAEDNVGSPAAFLSASASESKFSRDISDVPSLDNDL